MRLFCQVCATIAAALLAGAAPVAPHVSLDPNEIGKAPLASWPTFNGDYSGQRFSTLTQISPANVNRLAQRWIFRITSVGAQRGAPVPVIKCTPLLVNGVLYITIPDHVWALDARTGREIWHYDWVDHGGHLVGQRGVGVVQVDDFVAAQPGNSRPTIALIADKLHSASAPVSAKTSEERNPLRLFSGERNESRSTKIR